MSAPMAASPMAALVARQRAQVSAERRHADLLEQQLHEFAEPDADATCCSGFSCPACPPVGGAS